MTFRRILLAALLLVVPLLVLPTSSALAGAVLRLDDDSTLDLGISLQVLARQTQIDLDDDGDFESMQDMMVRRGRLALRAAATDKLSAYLQTALNSAEPGRGREMRFLDARIEYAAHPFLRFHAGLGKVPTSRQELSPASSRIAIDRPLLSGKVINRKGGVLMAFGTRGYADGEAGIVGDEGARDIGVTVFGSRPLADGIHLKYHLGVYDGVQIETSDAERRAARLQLNLGDPEPGFGNRAYYLGGKRTVALGVSYDAQQAVAADARGGDVDYAMLSADLFVERPFGAGVLSAEAGWTRLDFEDGVRLVAPAVGATPATTLDLCASQGEGWYALAGWLFDGVWQPWAEYESWTSDTADGIGGYTAWRAGLSWYLDGDTTHLKAGLERFTPEVPFSASESDLVSVVCAIFVSY